MDFKSIIVNGETYNVKDETARTQSAQAQSTAEAAQTTAGQAQSTASAAQTTAGQALSKANTNESNITEIAGESLAVSYVSESESIKFTKGIVIGG